MFIHLALMGLVGWLLVAEPLLGRRASLHLGQALDRGEADARTRFLLAWTWQGWTLVGVTLAIALGLAGWSPAQLGLAWPRVPAGLDGGVLLGMTASMIAGALIAAVGLWVAARRRHGTPAATPAIPAAPAAVLRMLPRTRRERLAFAALALTAGIGEEIVWRGFGLAVLRTWLPHAGPLPYVLLLATTFGWAHLYQGRAGVIVTALVGGVFAALYLASGSLLVPMVLHVLMDLRALLIRLPPDDPHAAASGPSTREVS
ncbi:CPBP family intramembrane glutamic endopeptidase [Dyella ginsengisoli]|uniref:CPBP family intramembrane glutamic endopeptidase n=1 Tax=Dyella ginsengisoli TaxID=363848 RepID=UPI00034A217F|nr:CPBP family intramembrane glutamic endopeptidase [Dyella ginsengisoli]